MYGRKYSNACLIKLSIRSLQLMTEFQRFVDLNNMKCTLKENGSKDNDLKRTLSDDVFPHIWSN